MINLSAPTFVSFHPLYLHNLEDWEKWRLAYDARSEFVDRYLKKLSSKESDEDFWIRKDIVYVPAFAQAAIDEIKNSIFQRTADVERLGGAPSYQEALKGVKGGIDLQGNSMGSFIGTSILIDLLVLSKVGVLVDAPSDIGTTLADKDGKRPFITMFRAENILNWYPTNPIDGFDVLLLRELVDELNELGLPQKQTFRYRLYKRTDAGVDVLFYDSSGALTDSTFLPIPKIPFTVLNLPRALMQNVADYQIALMNLESADISYARKANFPFYYEFYDPKTDPPGIKPYDVPGGTGEASVNKSRDLETKVGLSQGRRIAKGLDAPGFVNPDPDVLRVSMEKGEQLKEDIRLLVNLNLMNMNPRRQSAESKSADTQGLEAGLSFIGLVLQKGELEIAENWDQFEQSGKQPKITYPKSYSLKSEEQRQNEAEKLEGLLNKISSNTYKKEIAKKIVKLTAFEAKDEILDKMAKEIETADTLTSDPQIILQAHEAGLIDDVTASNAIGFNGEKVIAQARKDRAERIRLTLEAQGGPQGNGDGQARGATEFGGKTSSEEKEGKPTRGESKEIKK